MNSEKPAPSRLHIAAEGSDPTLSKFNFKEMYVARSVKKPTCDSPNYHDTIGPHTQVIDDQGNRVLDLYSACFLKRHGDPYFQVTVAAAEPGKPQQVFYAECVRPEILILGKFLVFYDFEVKSFLVKDTSHET